MSAAPEPPLAQALLARLRFERAMGLECLPAAPLAPASALPVQVPAAPPPARTAPLATTVQAAPSRAPDSPAPAVLDAAERARRWSALEARALGCIKCALHQTRTNVVFGEGSRDARLVFVGEGPGADEDASGRPFVGKAGQLLDKIIGAMGLKREEVYICNVLKCRPPGNRTPNPQEIGACSPFLEEQLELLSPKVIVTLGSPATQTLLKTTDGITRLRGHWRLYKGIRVMPTYHPAFVLRQYTKETRQAVWEDMQQVIKFLSEG